ncbi:MAG: hypothetical protein LH609_07240, partial [Rudanella sp.]|nr:hypothetical protein [Rudanella sp.]
HRATHMTINLYELREDARRRATINRLHQENNLSASGVGQMEAAFDVELKLKNGERYWIQIPQSAYDALIS